MPEVKSGLGLTPDFYLAQLLAVQPGARSPDLSGSQYHHEEMGVGGHTQAIQGYEIIEKYVLVSAPVPDTGLLKPWSFPGDRSTRGSFCSIEATAGRLLDRACAPKDRATNTSLGFSAPSPIFRRGEGLGMEL